MVKKSPKNDEIRKYVATYAGIKTGQAEMAIHGFVMEILELVGDGHVVRIPGLGRFSAKVRPARTGRNPRTGEPVAIPASRTLAFRPAPSTKTKIVE